MNLKERWAGCIEQWEWIVAEGYTSGQEGKEDWVKLHGGPTCHFCAHDLEKGIGHCQQCPGVLVDPTFTCMSGAYHYMANPKEFLDKLKELNPYGP